MNSAVMTMFAGSMPHFRPLAGPERCIKPANIGSGEAGR